MISYPIANNLCGADIKVISVYLITRKPYFNTQRLTRLITLEIWARIRYAYMQIITLFALF